jgi:hypothetical protein
MLRIHFKTHLEDPFHHINKIFLKMEIEFIDYFFFLKSNHVLENCWMIIDYYEKCENQPI